MKYDKFKTKMCNFSKFSLWVLWQPNQRKSFNINFKFMMKISLAALYQGSIQQWKLPALRQENFITTGSSPAKRLFQHTSKVCLYNFWKNKENTVCSCFSQHGMGCRNKLYFTPLLWWVGFPWRIFYGISLASGCPHFWCDIWCTHWNSLQWAGGLAPLKSVPCLKCLSWEKGAHSFLGLFLSTEFQRVEGQSIYFSPQQWKWGCQHL